VTGKALSRSSIKGQDNQETKKQEERKGIIKQEIMGGKQLIQ